MSKVFVAAATFNRPLVTRACLLQQASVLGPEAELHVWDDHSTDPVDMTGISCIQHKEPEHLGIFKIKAAQLEAFMRSGAEELYLTDTDMVLDPAWLTVCRALAHAAPVVSVFNCLHHTAYNRATGAVNGHPVIFRQALPGQSVYMLRPTVARIYRRFRVLVKNPWDYELVKMLGECAASEVSYCEHYGAGGFNYKEDEWDVDRAQNPTPYLQELNATLLPRLKAGG